MQKLSTKLLSILTIVMLLGVVLEPTLSYASSEIEEAKTTEENVSLNATINGEREANLDVQEGGNLELSLKVENTGYLKDIQVSLEDANYELAIPEEDEGLSQIKNAEDNKIELNDINAGEDVNIALPITFSKEEEKTAEDYGKESKVVFSAVYKNAQGKEKKVKKEISLNIDWNANAEAEINQTLTRYLKYGNNTMVSVEIVDGIRDNLIPVVEKELSIKTPKINNKNPDRVIVNAENVESYYDNGTLIITKKNEVNADGKISSISNDTYSVTYIYETQGDENQISTSAKETLRTIKMENVETNSENTFDVAGEVGSIVKVETETVEKINKGYMYTNTIRGEDKLVTQYEERYNIDVGLSELVDSIVLEQGNTLIKSDDSVIADVTGNVLTKKLVAENLEEMLGEEGSIKIFAVDGQELGTLNKDNKEIEISNTQIKIETSAPVKEGTLKILAVKEIAGDININIDRLKAANILSENIKLVGYKSETQISEETKAVDTALESPTSTATLSVSQNTLSTVVENKDVVFNVVLNKNKIENTLYKNPRITITLPEEVTAINVTDARVLYEDEIQAGSIEVGRNQLTVSLDGAQTNYLNDAVSEGTLVRIVANISLYNLAPSNEAPISLTYTNDLTGEENTLEGTISVVAPTGFVTTNTIEVDGKSETALESDKEEIEIQMGEDRKVATISGTIVNNLGEKAENAIIIGRLPFKGNKTISGDDLESNIDLSLASEIEVSGQEHYKVYYSNDGEADVNSNTWTETPSSNVKSYKIVFTNPIETGTLASFKYSAYVPAKLGIGSVAKTSYGVYYNNNAVEGVSTNLVQAKTVGIATPGIPNINAEVETIDTNDGHTIGSNEKVSEGQYVTYRIKVTNDGSKEAKNINVTADIPSELDLVTYTPGTDIDPMGFYVLEHHEGQVEQTIASLKPGETKNVDFNILVPETRAVNYNQYISKFDITAENEEGTTTLESTINNEAGGVSLKLSSDADGYAQKDKEVTYLILVRNETGKHKTNIETILHLPDGVEYVSSQSNADYDKNKNEVKVTINDLDSFFTNQILVKAKYTQNSQKALETYATATCNESNKEARSNTEVLAATVIENNLTATQKSSISSGNMYDTDAVELYIDIKNNTNAYQDVSFTDYVPEELEVLSYKVTVEGNTVREGSGFNSVTSSLSLDVGQSGRVTILAKPNQVTSGESKDIENKPEIKTSQGDDISVNSLYLKIQGTKTEETTNENKTLNIQGAVWYDENGNGKRDEGENSLSGIKLTLYNAETREAVKDENGNNVESTSNENGDYSFYNISRGKYNIVANYDKGSYDVGPYQAQGVSDSENSDFVTGTLNGEDVAVTDTLELADANIYNVDLSLSDSNRFDLSLDQTVSKVTVTNSKTNSTKTYDFNSNLAKFEIEGKELRDQEAFNSNTVLVEYKITVKNEGKVAGYAKSIVNYIPKGMEFNSELNKEWYVGKDGYAHTANLANTLINPGETQEISLVLTKKITENNIGTVRNTAEIEVSYNEQGLADINSEAANMQTGENDMASSDLVIATSAGRQIMQVTGITIGIIAIIAIAVYEIKKQVINKVEI